ncbi:MAG: hypothetical protein K9M99_06565 [Candidatus Cloacimonetes bacterium]|nr:hypothetical protein [Candidatus Cloacimonadota bacterium]
MNNQELKSKVTKTAGQLMYNKKYIAPVDLLLELGYLTEKDHESWRMGKIAFLEQACQINLKKLSLIMKTLRDYAKKLNYKPSFTAYCGWGKQKRRKLRFSKSGTPFIEQAYATHFISTYQKKEAVLVEPSED